MRSIIYVIKTPDTYSNSFRRLRHRSVCLIKSVMYAHMYIMLILKSLSDLLYKYHIAAPNTKRGLGYGYICGFNANPTNTFLE